jgi:glycosyltransferase involved in cell wall biosynthesis
MTVLIPAYEPTLNLLRLVLELKKKTNYKILIVDDGSGENYKELFKKAETLGCTVMHHEVNMGKGAALKTGFLHLLFDAIPDNVVCADSDGQHCADDIIKVANAISSTPEMVLGTRQFTGKVPLKSKMGNKMTSLILKVATGIDIKDTQTGLRGYPFHMLSWLRSVEGDRFEYELNLLLEAKKAKIRVKQVTIATIYDNNNKGTHFRPVKDSVRVLAPILKFCSSSVISGILDFFLLFLFQNLSGSLLVGVVSARLISSVFNYSFNKALVFKAKNVSNLQSAPKYFSLVAVVMVLNYGLLAFLTGFLGIPSVPAKLLTEMLLFILSYTVQRIFVFKQRGLNKTRPYILTSESKNRAILTNHMQSL